MTGRHGTLADRFWPKVGDAGGLDCWPWLASINDGGYGQISHEGRPLRAHRVAWELLRGEIPAGLQLDHLCRVRSCVNPWHLEPVTNAVNTERGELRNTPIAPKTHCPTGHPYDEANTRIDRQGHRRCRSCERRISLAHYHARKRPA